MTRVGPSSPAPEPLPAPGAHGSPPAALRSLFLTFLVLVLVLYVAALATRWRLVLQENRSQLSYVVSMLSQSVRMTATTHESLLRGLGGELVARGALQQPERGRALIERYQRVDAGMAGFGLARADGQLLLVSTLPPGTSLPDLRASPESAASFDEAVAQDRLVWGRPYYMKALARWVVPLRVPVQDEQGQTLAVMTAGYGIFGGTAAWANIQLPAGVHVGLVRDDGYLLYQSPLDRDGDPGRIERIFGVPQPAQDLQTYQALADRPDFGTFEHVSFQGGGRRFMAAQHLDETQLWAIAHVERGKLVREWLVGSLLPSALVLIVLGVGRVVYRRASRRLAESEAVLRYRAAHDTLTGLPNRSLLHAEFEQRAAGGGEVRLALMLLDLNGFKEINDTLGHHAGDALLQQIGPRLQRAVAGHQGLVARLGGDEFAVLVTLPEESAVLALARWLVAELRRPFDVQGMSLEVSAALGLAFYPRDGRDSHALLRAADVAMYRAKQRTSAIEIYKPQHDQHTPQRLTLLTELGDAIQRGELVLHYQPKLELGSGRVRGFEALVRWNHPRKGLLPPSEFMPAVEVSDAIHRLTETVLSQALAQQRIWREQFDQPMSVAVNLSPRNLIGTDIVSVLQLLMSFHGTGPDELELEITESSVLIDPVHAARTLQSIAALGVRISVDDFGTGYSSLSALQQLPIHALKVDRSFVGDLVRNEQNAAIVRSIVTMAHNLKLSVVAEGVEDEATLAALQAMGCDQAQGYFISRPRAWPEIEAWLRQRGA